MKQAGVLSQRQQQAPKLQVRSDAFQLWCLLLLQVQLPLLLTLLLGLIDM